MKLIGVLVCQLILRDARCFQPIPLGQKSLGFNNAVLKSIARQTEEQSERTDTGWSQFQDWAVRDNLRKYTIYLTRSGNEQVSICALWRTMIRDVPELCGFPLDVVRDMYSRQIKEQGQDVVEIPSIIPYLDQFSFEASGGISGRVYGLQGIVDGTKIKTTALTDLDDTLRKGYVQTSDNSTVFELGYPVGDTYSLSGLSSAVTPLRDVVETETDMLLKLGTSTAAVLAGAAAFGLLSHHLTINVFWV